MKFTKSDALTFGLELEFQIVNRETGLLSPSSLELWKVVDDNYHGRLTTTMLAG
jgi:carboxylate-amine ligase